MRKKGKKKGRKGGGGVEGKQKNRAEKRGD